jgi:hypothetical protein
MISVNAGDAHSWSHKMGAVSSIGDRVGERLSHDTVVTGRSRKGGGWTNVWGRRFNGNVGTPDGEAFQVTSFGSDLRMISANLSAMEIAIAANQLLLPVTESTSQLWTLENAHQ